MSAIDNANAAAILNQTARFISVPSHTRLDASPPSFHSTIRFAGSPANHVVLPQQSGLYTRWSFVENNYQTPSTDHSLLASNGRIPRQRSCLRARFLPATAITVFTQVRRQGTCSTASSVGWVTGARSPAHGRVRGCHSRSKPSRNGERFHESCYARRV